MGKHQLSSRYTFFTLQCVKFHFNIRNPTKQSAANPQKRTSEPAPEPSQNLQVLLKLHSSMPKVLKPPDAKKSQLTLPWAFFKTYIFRGFSWYISWFFGGQNFDIFMVLGAHGIQCARV